jgi:hypothetical protein
MISAAPSSPPAAARLRVPWLDLIGPAFLALSPAFAWTTELFSSYPAAPIYATELSIPFLVSGSLFLTRAPTVAQVFAVLAVGGSGLILAQTRWTDILRRVLGVCALILASLFAWRFNLSLEAVQFTPDLVRVFRLGFYLGVMGGILLIVLPGVRRLPMALPSTDADAEPGSAPAG